MTSAGNSRRACAVCGSADKETLFHQSFAGGLAGSLFEGYDVVVCRECGFGYADGLPDQRVFDEYYERMSKYEGEYAGRTHADFDARRFRAAAGFIRSLAPDLDSSIVDIGCSRGGLLDALRRLGYSRVLGVDPSPVCIETAVRLYGIRVVTGTLSRLPADLGRHDVALLSAILEHVRDLAGALAGAREALKPGGLLFVEVPDCTRFASAPDAPFQEFSVEHINYFSPTSLTNLLASAGFETIELRRTSTTMGQDVESYETRAMCRMGEAPVGFRPPRDAETRPALSAYIAESRGAERRVHEAIAPWVQRRAPIIVWGVGTHTQRLLATSVLAQADIRAFVDSNPRYQGKDLNGVPILAPSELKGRAEPILISSRAFQQEIERQIRDDLGLRNELILLYR